MIWSRTPLKSLINPLAISCKIASSSSQSGMGKIALHNWMIKRRSVNQFIKNGNKLKFSLRSTAKMPTELKRKFSFFLRREDCKHNCYLSATTVITNMEWKLFHFYAKSNLFDQLFIILIDARVSTMIIYAFNLRRFQHIHPKWEKNVTNNSPFFIPGYSKSMPNVDLWQISESLDEFRRRVLTNLACIRWGTQQNSPHR